jgi:hypothetical protein
MRNGLVTSIGLAGLFLPGPRNCRCTNRASHDRNRLSGAIARTSILLSRAILSVPLQPSILCTSRLASRSLALLLVGETADDQTGVAP